MKRSAGALSRKQQTFIYEYLKDLNGPRAARVSGYKADPRAAAKVLLDKQKSPVVNAAIESALQERARRSGIQADQVLSEIAKIAFFNPQDMLDHDGELLQLADMPEGVASALKELKITCRYGRDGQLVQQSKDVKWNDKLEALKLLGQHLGIFKDGGENRVVLDWGALAAAAQAKDRDVVAERLAAEQRLLDVRPAGG